MEFVSTLAAHVILPGLGLRVTPLTARPPTAVNMAPVAMVSGSECAVQATLNSELSAIGSEYAIQATLNSELSPIKFAGFLC